MNDPQAASAGAPGWFANLVDQATGIWVAGGWAMIPIAITAMVMFGLGLHIWLSLLAKGYRAVPEQVWRLWIEHPKHREGRLGELLDTVTDVQSLDQTAAAFTGVRMTELAGCQRDLKVMKVCIAVAPLLGLLGTVTGMLATFDALAAGAGGDQTMAAIARGISEALITTETGLVVALPGMFFQYQLVRQKERLAAFLAHLETVCTQHLHRVLARPTAA